MNKDYEKILVELCSKLMDMEHYGKKHVRINNIATRNIFSIFDELKEDIPYSTELLSKLIQYDDEKVKCSAASGCLKLNLHVQEAKRILFYIYENSKDSFRRASAFNTLIYHGYIKL